MLPQNLSFPPPSLRNGSSPRDEAVDLSGTAAPATAVNPTISKTHKHPDEPSLRRLGQKDRPFERPLGHREYSSRPPSRDLSTEEERPARLNVQAASEAPQQPRKVAQGFSLSPSGARCNLSLGTCPGRATIGI